MKSCGVNPMLALLVLALSLVVVASPASAGPIVLDFQAIGAGTAGGPLVSNCQSGALTPGCISNSGGEIIGKHIGTSSYILSLMAGVTVAENSSMGSCLPANGTATITAANGDEIDFKTVGWLCEQGGPGTPYHYNGTYLIEPTGTGRFADAFGAGNLAAAFLKGVGAPTSLKFDGTINY